MSQKRQTKASGKQLPGGSSDDELSSAARRKFLAALGLATLATGTGFTLTELSQASSGSDAVTDAKRWGLLIDTSKCSEGCDACVRGCNEEHGLTSTGRDDIDAQWIRKVDLQDRLTKRETSLPMLCQHCESAPCVDVCPTGASFKRADGIVLVNAHTCIGCRYCMMACPFKARSFIHEKITDQLSHAPRGKGTVESCTLCVHRIDSDKGSQTTACAQACSEDGHDAILFGDLNDPQSELSKQLREQPSTQVRSDLELNTGVRYI